MKRLKNKIQEQKKLLKKYKLSFQVIAIGLVIILMTGCTTSTPIYVPTTVPIPTIPNELKTPCPDIKEIGLVDQQTVSKWIVEEIDQHSKCIIKSKATERYLKLLEKYNEQQMQGNKEQQ